MKSEIRFQGNNLKLTNIKDETTSWLSFANANTGFQMNRNDACLHQNDFKGQEFVVSGFPYTTESI